MTAARVPLGPGGEFDLIRRILEQDAAGRRAGRPAAAGRRIIVGPGDDCAVIDGGPLAVSTDASIEDVHFRRAWLSPAETGFRAAAAALSDLAAMAATPIGLLATVAVATSESADFAVAVMAGVSEAACLHGAELLGGDLSRSPGPLMIDIAVLGDCPRPIRRGGAHPGDALWVTGSLGGAAAAVQAWNAGLAPAAAARAAFARPEPRLGPAVWLAEHGLASALIDLSDGLAGDVGHLAAASGACAVLELAQVPVHPAALEAAPGADAALRLALAGGEDYELCFASAAGAMEQHVPAFVERFNLRVTRVGTIRAGSGVVAIAASGSERKLESGGFSHFA